MPAPHKARKRFGQNFLHDTRALHRIVAALDLSPEDHVVEIGPGKGALTRFLLPACRRLDVVEIDRDLVARLQDRFAGHDHLHIHAADALQFDFAALGSGLKIVGNLPYNISTPLLFHLFRFKDVTETMVFMLQKEVVERLAAAPGDKRYGRLSVMAQYHCQVEKRFTVKPEAFRPRPRVMSAVVRLHPHRTPPVDVGDYRTFETLVARAFGQRRKTLRNALRDVVAEETIRACAIDPAARAETLPLDAFARLSRALCDSVQPATA